MARDAGKAANVTTLYAILARTAKVGLIFRRGPSRHVRLIGWDLNTHIFEPAQWLNGRVYGEKADLSPNGRRLVYLAAKHHGSLTSWTAVSNSPWLTAIVLWPARGTWNEISLFETDDSLALATFRADNIMAPAEGFVVPHKLRLRPKAWQGYFYKQADHERLIRDGWIVHSGDPIYDRKFHRKGDPLVYRKPLPGGTRSTCLQRTVHPSRDSIYSVLDDFDAVVEFSADWADGRGKDVFYSQGGKLFRMRVRRTGKRCECDPPIELADFTDMTFEAIASPARAHKW